MCGWKGEDGGISSAAAHSHLHCKNTLKLPDGNRRRGRRQRSGPLNAPSAQLVKDVLHLVPLRVSSFSGRHDDTPSNVPANMKTNLELLVQPVESVRGRGDH